MNNITFFKNRKLLKSKLHQWKLIDDRSGFIIYSNDAMVDEKGVITSKSNYDAPFLTEIPTYFPKENLPLPVVRLEPTDVFVGTEGLSYVAATWDNDPSLWGDESGNWEDSVII